MRNAVTTNPSLWPAAVDARAFGAVAAIEVGNDMPSCTLATGHKPEPRRPLTS